MNKIVHISDLHFGREDKKIVNVVLDDIHREQPSVVVVSGDLTQRAKRTEFKAAQEFLNKIPFPLVVVPGNHDIPLYNLYGRFIKRLSRFRKHISSNIDDCYEDEKLAIFGINSARSLTFKEGRISHKQIETLKENLSNVDDDKLKILVTHHPLPSLGRFGLALPVLEQGGVELVLAGHIHESSIGDLKADLMVSGRFILAIGAGTAFSSRTRGEPNSYNLVEIENNTITLNLRVWLDNKFVQAGMWKFQKKQDKWKRLEENPL